MARWLFKYSVAYRMMQWGINLKNNIQRLHHALSHFITYTDYKRKYYKIKSYSCPSFQVIQMEWEIKKNWFLHAEWLNDFRFLSTVPVYSVVYQTTRRNSNSLIFTHNSRCETISFSYVQRLSSLYTTIKQHLNSKPWITDRLTIWLVWYPSFFTNYILKLQTCQQNLPIHSR